MLTKNYSKIKFLIALSIYINGLSFQLSKDPTFQAIAMSTINFCEYFELPGRDQLRFPLLY